MAVQAIGVIVGAFVLLLVLAGGLRAAVGVSPRAAEATTSSKPGMPKMSAMPATRARGAAPTAHAVPQVAEPRHEDDERYPRGVVVRTSPPETRHVGHAGDLTANYGHVSITIYTTPWCGYCKQAKSWMDARGLSYTEHDIEDDAEAAKRARALNPGGGVPLINVDGELVRGFSERSLEAALDRAARRRP